jgi:hypothetical protein
MNYTSPQLVAIADIKQIFSPKLGWRHNTPCNKSLWMQIENDDSNKTRDAD